MCGVVRRRFPSAARLKGLPFGATFFLMMDELMNPALRFTPGPTAFPGRHTRAASVVTWRLAW
jgi:hypothetical protein